MRSCKVFEKTTAAFNMYDIPMERGENCGENAKKQFLKFGSVAEKIAFDWAKNRWNFMVFIDDPKFRQNASQSF